MFFNKMFIFAPVSYTHLDVYKRQVLVIAAVGLVEQKLESKRRREEKR